MKVGASRDRVWELVDRQQIEIDLVIASARSHSTPFCLALVTVGDYSLYLHEPFRIAAERHLNPATIFIGSQPARSYDPYRHMLEEYDSPGRDGNAGEPLKILMKEMCAGEAYEEYPAFPHVYANLLHDIMPLTRKKILVSRDTNERLDSLHKVPESDSISDFTTLVKREDEALVALQHDEGLCLIDLSANSALMRHPEQFFDDMVQVMGRRRLEIRDISEFDTSAVAADLILIDQWARSDFMTHAGFVKKTGLPPRRSPA